MSTFAASLNKFARKAGLSLDTAYRGIITELFSSVILATPVDTGRARANWMPSVNNYTTSITIGTLDPRGSGTIALVNAMRYGITDKVYLTNNLPYIYRLEYEAWSKQAPAGMVRKNMARIQNVVQRAARRAR